MMNFSDSELEDLYHKAEQRNAIVKKYSQGHDTPQVKWDDPNNPLSGKVDIYGFIHHNGIPQDVQNAHNVVCKKDSRRQEKWLKIMPPQNYVTSNLRSASTVAFQPSEWSRKYFKNNEASPKLRRYIYKGIPRSLRGQVWRLLLNLPVRVKQQENVYERVCQRALQRSPDVHQIDLDVNRTFREHEYFYELRNTRQSMLFRVLASYSLYNTDVGYCQGMSGIAALMIMYLNEEEEVFWALSQLFTEPIWGMHGFFMPQFPKLMRFCRHHEAVIKQMLPSLHKHFTKISLPTTAYAVKWFMQCFLDRLPLTLILRLWDIYLIEGDRLLVGMAYTILKHFQDDLKRKDDSDILIFLQEKIAHQYFQSDDDWIKELRDNIEELRRKKLDRPPQPTENESPVLPFNPINAGCPSLDEVKKLYQAKQRNVTTSQPTSRTINTKLSPHTMNGSVPYRAVETHF